MLVKSAIFSILFLALVSISFAQSSTSHNLYKEVASPELGDNLRIIPVQFLEKTEQANGNIDFSAIFASRLIVERINFLLLNDKNPDNKASFFEQNDEWEEQIDRKGFLKKFKKDYWLTTYLTTGQENIIIAAHQFESWQAVKDSYASHPDLLRRNVENLDFWQDLRMRMLYFYQIDEKMAYWLLLDPIDITEPVSESDRQTINLNDGYFTYKRVKDTNNRTNDFRLISHGVLYLQPNTVFHRQEIENSKPRKVLKFTIIDAKLRLKPVVIEKEYFLRHYQNHFWVCFYDSKYQSLVRIVEVPEKYPSEDKKQN